MTNSSASVILFGTVNGPEPTVTSLTSTLVPQTCKSGGSRRLQSQRRVVFPDLVIHPL